jgi:hypothetical protein
MPSGAATSQTHGTAKSIEDHGVRAELPEERGDLRPGAVERDLQKLSAIAGELRRARGASGQARHTGQVQRRDRHRPGGLRQHRLDVATFPATVRNITRKLPSPPDPLTSLRVSWANGLMWPKASQGNITT